MGYPGPAAKSLRRRNGSPGRQTVFSPVSISAYPSRHCGLWLRAPIAGVERPAMRVRCYLCLTPGRALLSGFDRLSAPDRRSPTSCFSASDRVSVPDRRSFEVLLASPDRFSSLPIVVSVGLPRIMLDRPRLSHESPPGGLQSWIPSPSAPTRQAADGFREADGQLNPTGSLRTIARSHRCQSFLPAAPPHIEPYGVRAMRMAAARASCIDASGLVRSILGSPF